MKHTSRMSSSRWLRGSSPSTLRSPSKAVRPRIVLSAVVLPAPFGPMSPTIRPGSIAKLTPSSARLAPKLLVRLLASTIAVIFFTWRGGGAATPGRRPRSGRRRSARALQVIGAQAEALNGGVDLRPLLLEEALPLVLHQRLARAGAHEHAESPALLHELLIDQLLVALEHGQRVEPEVGCHAADRR